MNLHIENDGDFEAFKNELKRRLQNRTMREINNGGYRISAVMMLIFNKNNTPHVLLTLRTHKVATHKGEISFPGGGLDSSDRDILETAYRETDEEVGIPRADIEYLGRFDDYLSIWGFHVTVFIGALRYPFSCTINHDEIEKLVCPTLDIFVKKNYDRYEIYNHRGQDYKVYYYDYEGETIWGMTARILTDFGEEICY